MAVKGELTTRVQGDYPQQLNLCSGKISGSYGLLSWVVV